MLIQECWQLDETNLEGHEIETGARVVDSWIILLPPVLTYDHDTMLSGMV